LAVLHPIELSTLPDGRKQDIIGARDSQRNRLHFLLLTAKIRHDNHVTSMLTRQQRSLQFAIK
jgi:hypothetical protein